MGCSSPPKNRADLEEQHAISEEIADALSSAPLGQHVDEDELDEELAELQQEQLDEKMMKTGHVPVGDTVDRLPTVSGREREFFLVLLPPFLFLFFFPSFHRK